MKHIFVINPAAGKGKGGIFLSAITNVAQKRHLDYEIHRTLGPREATHFVRSRCEARTDDLEKLRFYSCGGDGTLHEVINGLCGINETEVALLPIGTGNDFARNFPQWKFFSDLERQIDGVALPIDLISYQGIGSDGKRTAGYCINMMNLGFECDVVIQANRLKSYVPLTGPLVYGGAATTVIMKNRCFNAFVRYNDGFLYEGSVFMLTVANGRFCGGGFQSAPTAQYDDGLLDINLVKKIRRRELLRLVSRYKRGAHVKAPLAKKVLIHKKSKKVTVLPKQEISVAADGEILTVRSLEISIVSNAIFFSRPS